MCDDFWGIRQWEVFMASMQRVFPDRQIVDLENSDQIFHTVYDLDDRYQVPAQGALAARRIRSDGVPAHWRGIYDDKGRLMVAIDLQLRPRRFLGVGRSPSLPGAILRARHPHRRELHYLRDDALASFSGDDALSGAVYYVICVHPAAGTRSGAWAGREAPSSA